MKLIDVLVQELPRRGGWPEGVEEIWQDYDRMMRTIGWFHDELCDDHRRQHHDAHVKISRKQYESALAARKTEWDGDGLPPVGCECEIKRIADWMPVTIRFISDYHTVFKTFGGTEDCYQTCSLQFRLIRSDEDRKKEKSIKQLARIMAEPDTHNASIIYSAIADGKVPGIKLE